MRQELLSRLVDAPFRLSEFPFQIRAVLSGVGFLFYQTCMKTHLIKISSGQLPALFAMAY